MKQNAGNRHCTQYKDIVTSLKDVFDHSQADVTCLIRCAELRAVAKLRETGQGERVC